MKMEALDKNSAYFNLFRDFWNLQKKYINGDANHERSDKYWDELLYDAAVFPKEHAGYEDFSKSLIWAFLDEVERRHKKETGEVSHV